MFCQYLVFVDTFLKVSVCDSKFNEITKYNLNMFQFSSNRAKCRAFLADVDPIICGTFTRAHISRRPLVVI